MSIGGTTPKFLGWPNPSLYLSLSFPFTLSSLLPFPSIPLEVGPLNRSRGLGGTVSSPSGVWGRAPAESEIVAF